METIIIHTEAEKLKVITEFLKLIKVKFEISSNNEKSIYPAEFNEMIKQGDIDIKEGRGKAVNFDDEIWK